jgi:hypothetical protein
LSSGIAIFLSDMRMSGICECSNLHPVWEITDLGKGVVAGIVDPGSLP